MSRYEVWNKKNWGTTGGQPGETKATLDMAIVWAKAEIIIDGDILFIFDKGQSPSKVRGFVIKGKWLDAVDNCKRCGNTGNDYSGNWYAQQVNVCTNCRGASWRPF